MIFSVFPNNFFCFSFKKKLFFLIKIFFGSGQGQTVVDLKNKYKNCLYSI